MAEHGQTFIKVISPARVPVDTNFISGGVFSGIWQPGARKFGENHDAAECPREVQLIRRAILNADSPCILIEPTALRRLAFGRTSRRDAREHADAGKHAPAVAAPAVAHLVCLQIS